MVHFVITDAEVTKFYQPIKLDKDIHRFNITVIYLLEVAEVKGSCYTIKQEYNICFVKGFVLAFFN